VTGKLTWTHYADLLGVSDDYARGFYEKQAINENWSVRELKRQIGSSLFERLALSQDKSGILKLSKKGQLISQPKDIVKDPYVLEFLQFPEEYRMSESKLEQKIIDNLQTFLLELGKGFSFVGRQYRITLDNDHYYVDLVFYHRILKCFVLIDLKTKHVKHQDIGQMNMYLNYFKSEENTDGDNPPIGIVLGADKNDILVEYAIGGISNNIFVSKYQLYLPDRKVLEQKVKELITEENSAGNTASYPIAVPWVFERQSLLVTKASSDTIGALQIRLRGICETV
jgi:predicted nuclease of restriction endonuclease-like (RecB) superfamily